MLTLSRLNTGLSWSSLPRTETQTSAVLEPLVRLAVMSQVLIFQPGKSFLWKLVSACSKPCGWDGPLLECQDLPNVLFAVTRLRHRAVVQRVVNHPEIGTEKVDEAIDVPARVGNEKAAGEVFEVCRRCPRLGSGLASNDIAAIIADERHSQMKSQAPTSRSMAMAIYVERRTSNGFNRLSLGTSPCCLRPTRNFGIVINRREDDRLLLVSSLHYLYCNIDDALEAATNFVCYTARNAHHHHDHASDSATMLSGCRHMKRSPLARPAAG